MPALGHWDHLANLGAWSKEQLGLDFEHPPALPFQLLSDKLVQLRAVPGPQLDHTLGSVLDGVQDELDGEREAMSSCPQHLSAQGCSFPSLGSFQKTRM